MEKYSQFRDRGSGISPFMPIKTPTSTFTQLVRTCIFLFRLVFFVPYCAFFFLVLNNLPLPLFAHKLLLWTVLAIPGIWWVDLQLDGVKRGSLSSQPDARFPHARTIIAAQFTSPIDALYLSAVFDPIFTMSYPGTKKVQRISLFRAVTLALAPPPPQSAPPENAKLTTLAALVDQYPQRAIVVFPEMTTTNGKGIMPFSPSLLSAPSDVKIFPVSMRYTPPDITTPVPGSYFAFLWNLLGKPTHYIRVRIAEAVKNTAYSGEDGLVDGIDSIHGDSVHAAETKDTDGEALTPEEHRLLDRVGEALARLARNQRVGLTTRDKARFVEAWGKKKK
ncbi:hypothetical protein F4778DRAFT_713274 [Xylariomycetidae sp. FL2044]|nr:hypothetical protein F4778DRAFT_713274 [Xylariomycetidae sp. FL2044]